MATKKEQEYIAQLKALGVYTSAFDPAIHELCLLEGELKRARRQLSSKTPKGQMAPYADPLYTTIRQLQRDILAYRDSLGLTPKSLKKLKGEFEKSRSEEPKETALSLIQKKHGNVWQSNPTA